MKKLFLSLALLGAVILASNKALATDPCAKYNVTALVAGCIVNGHTLTVGVPFAFSDGDVLTTTLPTCNQGMLPVLTTWVRGYIFVPPNSYALSHTIGTQLPQGCESATYILHTNTAPDCSSATPSAAPLTSYCPCEG